jgi:hypothetical protein
LSKATPKNIEASIRQRLLDHSRAKGEDFNLTLTRYASERFLYRLSRTEYAAKFILKGAMLFAFWTDKPHRPTADLDFLGRGVESAAELRKIFEEVCRAAVVPDGLEFKPESITVEAIREDQAYQGLRVRVAGKLGKARVSVQADIGFGDIVKPRPKSITFPTILDLPAPRVKAYPPEAVIAEKFQAMVNLGMANSRMKDFYDLYLMARSFNFEGRILAEAITATFKRRKTDLPVGIPLALSEEFAGDADKRKQWKGFLARNRLDATGLDLSEVVEYLRLFLMPLLTAVSQQKEFNASWSNGGPWKK